MGDPLDVTTTGKGVTHLQVGGRLFCGRPSHGQYVTHTLPPSEAQREMDASRRPCPTCADFIDHLISTSLKGTRS